ncbi:unnamed protein product [Triticum turgidum subsp. durum]|uniref:Uncharacterized protein n=1 Tax=Triticum turgidum subsp. durum TaxID=4567 RepID=A0A9R1QJ27_TRITD|nr:unnamed protein product [Triticum turgidum subsp. durum]
MTTPHPNICSLGSLVIRFMRTRDVLARLHEYDSQGAAHQNPDELVPEPEICEPMVKEAAAEHAHGRHVPDEGLPQTKASIAPTKDCRAEGTADDQKENLCQEEANEDLCASKPRENMKKTSRRRLLPVSAMMLKEFTGPAIGLDGGGAKASSGEQSAMAAGRSDALIRLLKAKAPPMRHRRG